MYSVLKELRMGKEEDTIYRNSNSKLYISKIENRDIRELEEVFLFI